MRFSRALRQSSRKAVRAAAVPFFPVIRPRRIDVCCCGLSKTGTHSIAGLFSQYRSAHHPDAQRRLQLATSVRKVTADGSATRRVLARRDRSMWLEVESSYLAGELIAYLMQACPDKRFILTIRDVYSWADSWIDHNLNWPVEPTSMWAASDRARLRVEDYPHTRHDGPLRARELPSLASLFQLWAVHNQRVLHAVPSSKLLVIRTGELIQRSEEIAQWCGVPLHTLTSDQAWLHASPTKHKVLSKLDSSYVRETAESFCGSLMRTHFPDVTL